MPGTAQGIEPKVIVVPRPLEGFFFERLRKRYEGCDHVLVIVDRRVGERRQPRWVVGPGPLSDRRRGDRRDGGVAWSLPDLPFVAS